MIINIHMFRSVRTRRRGRFTMVVGKEAAQTPSRLRVFSSTPDATTCHPEFSKQTIHNKTHRRKLSLNRNSSQYANQ